MNLLEVRWQNSKKEDSPLKNQSDRQPTHDKTEIPNFLKIQFHNCLYSTGPDSYFCLFLINNPSFNFKDSQNFSRHHNQCQLLYQSSSNFPQLIQLSKPHTTQQKHQQKKKIFFCYLGNSYFGIYLKSFSSIQSISCGSFLFYLFMHVMSYSTLNMTLTWQLFEAGKFNEQKNSLEFLNLIALPRGTFGKSISSEILKQVSDWMF